MRRLAVVVLAALLVGTASARAAEFPLAAGCVGRDAPATLPDPRVPAPIMVHCGGHAAPDGRVAADWLEAEPAALDGALSASPVWRDMALRLACGPAKPDGDGLSAACAQRDGGWPAVALARVHGRLLLVAEGGVSTRPALEAALARLSGRPAKPAPAAAPDMAAAYKELTEQARLLNGKGDHSSAEQAYRKALDLQRKALGDADPALGNTLMHLALEVSNQGRFIEAAELFKQAEPLVQRSLFALERPRLASYLALDAANRHDYAAARDWARQATAGRKEIAAGASPADARPARIEAVHSLLIEATTSLKLDDVASASVAASEALSLSEDETALPGGWKPAILAVLGDIRGRQNRYGEGEELVKQSLELNRKLYGDGMPTALAYATLGRYHAEYGRYGEAMEDFRQAFLRLAQPGLRGQKLSFEVAAAFFDTALELAGQPGASQDSRGRERIMDEVFSVLQMVQGGGQTDAVSHAALKFATSDPRMAELVAARQEAERHRDETRLILAADSARPDDMRDADREAWLAEEYRAAQATMDELDGRLRRDFPDYAALANPPPVTIARLRTVLAPGEAVLSFAFGDKSGLALAVTADAVEARVLPISGAELATLVGDLRQGIQVRDGRVPRYDLKLAHQLYAALVAPLGPVVTGAGQLLVVPGGAMASLPLAALVAAPPASADPARADWLVRHAAISQWPTVAALVAMRGQSRPSAAPLPLLGVANPHFAGQAGGLNALSQACRDQGPVPASLLAQLAPLPDTEPELRSVARTLKARDEDLLIGDGASEAALKARKLGQYRVLYFATHGLLPAELKCQSEPGLALSPPAAPAQSRAEDGLLEISEIAGLGLDAELVALSACNTASSGGRFGGESLSSLADSFFHAGARSVLATHWSVPSVSTRRLMSRLFELQAARPGDGYAAALRAAQLELVATPETAHPVHWAAFTLIGGTRTDKAQP